MPNSERRLTAAGVALLATLAVAPSGLAVAQDGVAPQLLSAVDAPPAAALAWDRAERARSPMITRSAFVRVDVAALRAIPVTGAPPLSTFGLELFEHAVSFDVHRTQWKLGYRVVSGVVRGKDGTVQLTIAPDGTTYGLAHIGARCYELAYTSSGDVHVLHEIDPSRLPASMACGNPPAGAAPVPLPGTGSGGTDTNSHCGFTTVDIIVFYTPLARQNAGGTSAIEAAIVGAVELVNSGNLLSGVPLELRLVHVTETPYVETGAATDLFRFRTNGDGHMDEVFGVRDTYGGDLMHLITDPAVPQNCGWGMQMTSLTPSFGAQSFALTVRTCIPNHTFTHECGHNMGCHHDQANAGAQPPFPYSYGYRTPDNAYRTVMAYPPGTRINRWSSPNVQHLGYTMGTPGSADNARSLDIARATVRQFYATRTPVWCDLYGGVPGAQGLPTLTGDGTINQVRPLTLTARNYAPGTVGALAVGASTVHAPLFGGTLVPSVDVAVTLTGTGAEIVHDASWLANLSPGFEVWCQAVFFDASAPQGVAASHAVKVTRP